jgi:hypothetical protein
MPHPHPGFSFSFLFAFSSWLSFPFYSNQLNPFHADRARGRAARHKPTSFVFARNLMPGPALDRSTLIRCAPDAAAVGQSHRRRRCTRSRRSFEAERHAAQTAPVSSRMPEPAHARAHACIAFPRLHARWSLTLARETPNANAITAIAVGGDCATRHRAGWAARSTSTRWSSSARASRPIAA